MLQIVALETIFFLTGIKRYEHTFLFDCDLHLVVEYLETLFPEFHIFYILAKIGFNPGDQEN